MYKTFLALRYLRKRRITYFAVMSLALCTAMVLGVHSVMSGFLNAVKESSRHLLGDVILEIGSMTNFPLYDEFIAEMGGVLGEDLVVATPVILNAGWVTLLVDVNDQRTFPVIVTGIRLDEYRRVNRLGQGLYYEHHFPGSTSLQDQRKPMIRRDAAGLPRLPADLEAALARYVDAHPDHAPTPPAAGGPWPGPGQFKEPRDPAEEGSGYHGQSYPGLILGISLVAERRAGADYERSVPRGTLTRLTVLPHNRRGTPDASMGDTAAFRYTDDARSGIHDIDSRSAYVDFGVLQRTLELDGSGGGMDRPRATQIQVKLAAGVDLDHARDVIQGLWLQFLENHYQELSAEDVDDMQFMRVQTWRQRNASFINAVEKQRIVVLILLGVISVVAVVLVGCTFYMIVQERTLEIGIIKSLGADRLGVGGMFLTYAAAVGVVGSIIGVIIGTLFVHYINDIQDWLAILHPRLRMWSPEVYSFERIPNTVLATDAAVIIGVGILAAIIGSTVAAWKAAHVWPTRALHYR